MVASVAQRGRGLAYDGRSVERSYDDRARLSSRQQLVDDSGYFRAFGAATELGNESRHDFASIGGTASADFGDDLLRGGAQLFACGGGWQVGLDDGELASFLLDEVGPVALLELGDRLASLPGLAGQHAALFLFSERPAFGDLGVVQAGTQASDDVAAEVVAGTHGDSEILRQSFLEAHVMDAVV
jgi:hypothetical protein